MARGPAVRVPELREFQRGLKRMEGDFDKEFKRELAAVAEESAMDARGSAQGGRPQQKRAAYNIVGKGTFKGAVVEVANTAEEPFTLGAFFGSKRPQFPGIPWVGNSWEAGEPREGPYFVNAAIASNADRAEEKIGDLVEDIAYRSRAFPDRSL